MMSPSGVVADRDIGLYVCMLIRGTLTAEITEFLSQEKGCIT